MIARHETHMDKVDIWSELSAPLPPDSIEWRQDGRPVSRDGKHFARFVAYITANTVRKRLDSVVTGEFDSTLELLPSLSATGGDGESNDEPCAFKCRLQILGVIREDVGTGKDYKSAATDAFKRAAVRFGIGHELYDMEHLWVQMDGDGKYAKPVEDPSVAYARRFGRPSVVKPVVDGQVGYGAVEPERGERASGTDEISHSVKATDQPSCPKCGAANMYDNRSENDARAARGEKLRPDWKCRQRGCEGIIWRPKPSATKRGHDAEEMEETPF